MKPEYKARWAAALRSGQYKQTTQTLASKGCFCALGVACDLFAKEAGVEVKVKATGQSYDGSLASLPLKLQEYLELNGWGGFKEPIRIKDRDRYDVVALNDEAKLTFPEIADIIEKQF